MIEWHRGIRRSLRAQTQTGKSRLRRVLTSDSAADFRQTRPTRISAVLSLDKSRGGAGRVPPALFVQVPGDHRRRAVPAASGALLVSCATCRCGCRSEKLADTGNAISKWSSL